jgi:glycosyltransferase involved in cell wall biosynthesis
MDKDRNYLFSVVISSYNCADKLKKALVSLSKQTCQNFEVIICDSSCDHTKQVVNSFEDSFKLKYIWEKSRGGPAHARNSGIKASQGEYIAFLDADDWWFPAKLETISRYLSQADILYHNLDIYTSRGKKILKKIKGRHLKSPVFIDLMKNENALITSSVVVKRSTLEEAGGFTEGELLEDFDLWLRISKITERFFYISKSLGGYFIGNGSRSGASQKMLNMLRAVYEKHLQYLEGDNRKQAEYTRDYLLARIKLRMGFYQDAIALFRQSAYSKNVKFKLRSWFWLLILNNFLFFNKN